MVVHYAGVGCEMDAIRSVADEAGLSIIEDNAHGLLGSYKGKPLGTFGVMATQSFHETKNLTCGKGGALLLNDTDLLDRAKVIRNKGTNRAQFMEGLVDKYTWVGLGSSYQPSTSCPPSSSASSRRELSFNRSGVKSGSATKMGWRSGPTPKACSYRPSRTTSNSLNSAPDG